MAGLFAPKVRVLNEIFRESNPKRASEEPKFSRRLSTDSVRMLLPLFNLDRH